jgi:ribosome-associated translation inhibitor RaiA
MPIPLQITFRGLPPSESIDNVVRQKAERLERFHHRIESCHVIIDAPPQHQRKGGTFRVNVKLTVPGGEIAASRDSGKDHSHEDLRVALRDTFAAAVRQLEDHMRLQRGDVKRHSAPRRASRWSPSQEE